MTTQRMVMERCLSLLVLLAFFSACANAVPKCFEAATNTSWTPGTSFAVDSCNTCTCPYTGGKLLCTSIAVVQCLVDPCQTAKCPAYPNAKCASNYCGGCNAVFSVNGKVVDCKKKPPPPPRGIPLNGGCTIGSLIDKSCAPGLVCVLTKQGRPEIDIPNVGTCKPQSALKCKDLETRTFWAPGTILKKPNCIQCYCPEGGRNFSFSCGATPVCDLFRDPCQGERCYGYPNAKCRLERCSQCSAEWYIGEQVVECKKPPPPPPPKGVAVNGVCTIGSLIPQNCAAGLVCVLDKQGKPELDIPNVGICKPRSADKCQDLETRMFWGPGVIVKKPNCNSCKCVQQLLPTKKFVFSCSKAPYCLAVLSFPCSGATCPGYPTAKCRPDPCASCLAEWYIGDQTVTCKPPPPRLSVPITISLNGKCLVGTRGAKQCAKGLVCLLTKSGKPEVDIPNEGTCKPSTVPKCQDPETQMYWALDTSFKKPNCINCNCYVNPTTKKPEFSCVRAPVCSLAAGYYPCDGRTCPGFPTAKCRLDTCSSCYAEWYIGDQIVECGPEPPTVPENGTCLVRGFNARPCARGLTCWLTTGAQLEFGPHKGICTNIKKVKSCYEKTTKYYWAPKSVHDTPPCGRCTCPATGGSLQCTRVLAQCFANPCQVSKCPKYPNAECRSNYCGGCYADYYVNGKKVDCYAPA